MFNGLKQNGILSFFKPVAKQTPTKRPCPDEPLPDDAQQRSHSPKRYKTASPKDTHVRPPPHALPLQKATEKPPELSPSSTQSAGSQGSDSIEVYMPSQVSTAPKSATSDPLVTQSFRSSGTSSHRIERYGETIITGSDDDSDDFPELDELFGQKPLHPKPPPRAAQERKIQSKSSRKAKQSFEDTSKADQIKFSNLLEKAKKEHERSENQRKALEQAKEFEQASSQGPLEQEVPKVTLTAETIVSRVGDLDAEKAEKFAQVIERTELAKGVQSWSFFSTSSPSPKAQDTSRPVRSDHGASASISNNVEWKRLGRKWPELSKHPAWSIYKASPQRDLAFISGVFEQAAAAHQLPEEILLWILNQSFVEPQADLRNAYHLVLKYADTCISSDQILKHAEMVLHVLGATAEAMSTSSEKIHTKASDARHPDDQVIPREPLRIWLRNVRKLISSMSVLDRTRILDLLFILALDTALLDDAFVLTELQTALVTFIDYTEESLEARQMLDRSLRRVFEKAGDIHFRLQFLKCMPASNYTVAHLRKRFAGASFNDDSTCLDSDPKPGYLSQMGALFKKTKQFQMTRKTNYHNLSAYIACFDMAIGAGNEEGLADEESIKQFNLIIDDLIEIIRTKQARIQTTGAVHMSRTEVKDTLATIEKRLSFAVRTERKQRRNMFDQSTLDNLIKK